MIPPVKLFKDTMKRYGVTLNSRVVFYDARAGFHATRAFWMFRTFGILGVSALNGGLKKWMDEGRPIETTENASNEEDYDFKVDP